MVVRIPTNQITPHGWYQLVKGEQPMMRLTAYDGSVEIYMLGGHSVPDRIASPECVHIMRDGLTGLIAPWQHITQKGAVQDGVTHIDALYDPIEVGLKLVCKGRDAKHTRWVYRLLTDSIDAKQESELAWYTQDMGYWWAPVRWFKGAPPDPVKGAQEHRQPASLRLQADSGFWRSYDDTDTFAIPYDSTTVDFGEDSETAGENWPVYSYEGTAGGHAYIEDGELKWAAGGNGDQAVVLGPYRDFDTETDIQVINLQVGAMPQLVFAEGTFVDLWGRMGKDVNGDWDGNGVRARIGRNGLWGWVWLSRFNDFVETPLFDRNMFLPPLRTEKFTLLCGTEDDPRMFRVLRSGWPVLSHKESGTGSVMGEDYRGVGVGVKATTGDEGQAAPPWITTISADDNVPKTYSGWLRRTNIGDQPMYDDYTLFGPFDKVKIYDGPASDDFVEFGPLFANQIVELRTDPRTNTTLVQDLTVIPATPQQLNVFQDAVRKLLSFMGVGGALGNQIKSQFGIRRPQGNLYKYLKGRFSDSAAIPPKSPGNPAEPYFVKVELVGATPDSRVIASGTPLRRYPL